MSIDQTSRPELSDAEKRALMSTIKRIVTIYDELVPVMTQDQRAHRDDGVNPVYHQTTNGLYLLYTYGLPYELWTPWGLWRFGANDRMSQDDIARFESRLSLREYVPSTDEEWATYGGVYGALVRHADVMGPYGPVYAVLAVEGEELPEPTPVLGRVRHADVDPIIKDWSRHFTEAS
jgi:hypothetical protein